MARERERTPRGPGTVLAVASLAIVVLVAALAITASQTPPPAIAELAPESVKQITDAPTEQSSNVGEGDGGSGFGGATTSTTAVAGPGGIAATVAPTTVPPVVRARVRRCVGNPPRQIEDPQSPPCVPYWQGDNGGATYKGVTADTIRIALPPVYSQPQARPILEGFFNKRFEFYGRRIELVTAGGGGGCVGFKAAAADLAAQNFFAVLDSNHDDASCLYAELARRKIMSAGAPVLFDDAQMQELRPYAWQYQMSTNRQFAALGEMVCNRLKGGLSEHAKGLQFNQPRKFGIILQYNTPDKPIELDPLERAMTACGAKPVVYRQAQSADGQQNLERSQAAILAMQSAQVTSVVCLCKIFAEAFMGSYATGQGYFPEWILSSYGSNDVNFLIRSVGWPNAEQRTQILGMSVMPRQLNQEEEPYWWMIKEMNPNLRREDVNEYGSAIFNAYHSLLVIASGIQMAGPILTPETFERGLHQAKFPNPLDHPNQAGKVGFADKDYSMTDDAVEFWWSENDRAPDSVGSNAGTAGTLCYLDRGARRDRGRWPKGKGAFFQPPCYSGA